MEDPDKLKELAGGAAARKKRLVRRRRRTRSGYRLTGCLRLYSSCNAGQSWTHLANRLAFYRHQVIPRTLVDTSHRDTATTIFGHRVAAPIGFAPIGINRIYHPTGELSPAALAGELNLAYCLSSAASYSIEDVARANGDGPRFYQLYWSPDDKVTVSMLERAARSGYTALILTTDTWQLGWRHDDVALGNYAFYHEHGAGDLGLRDPAFLESLKEAGLDPERDFNKVGARWIDKHIWHGHSFTWKRLPWLMAQWKRISGGKPFCIKGIQNAADAREAVRAGVDGIVVSNHTGRQVDGAVASLDALERIVDAVGDKTYVGSSTKPVYSRMSKITDLATGYVRLWHKRSGRCFQGPSSRGQIRVHRETMGLGSWCIRQRGCATRCKGPAGGVRHHDECGGIPAA